jgi:hypothetical protein
VIEIPYKDCLSPGTKWSLRRLRYLLFEKSSNFPCNNPPDFTQYIVSGQFDRQASSPADAGERGEEQNQTYEHH